MNTEQGVLAHQIAAFRPAMLRWLSSRGVKPELAEEVFQQASLQALEKLHQLRDPQKITPWFKQILKNMLINEYRRQSVLAPLKPEILEHMLPDASQDTSPESCACALALLERIPAQYAQLIEKVILEGVPVKHVAKSIGIHANNASVRLLRAKKSLLRQLNAQCGTTSVASCYDCSC